MRTTYGLQFKLFRRGNAWRTRWDTTEDKIQQHGANSQSSRTMSNPSGFANHRRLQRHRCSTGTSHWLTTEVLNKSYCSSDSRLFREPQYFSDARLILDWLLRLTLPSPPIIGPFTPKSDTSYTVWMRFKVTITPTAFSLITFLFALIRFFLKSDFSKSIT